LTCILAEPRAPDLIAAFYRAHHLSFRHDPSRPISIFPNSPDIPVARTSLGHRLMQETKSIHQYNGYSISPSARRFPDGWFAANLLLVADDSRSREPASYEFHALDYFDNETQALEHATSWAHGWVDNRG
jgi:hypothetical protein